MKTFLVGGSAALLACLFLSGCGSKTTSDGREIKPRAKDDAAVIDPPEKALNDSLKNNAGGAKPR